jgi:hypothetical protein
MAAAVIVLESLYAEQSDTVHVFSNYQMLEAWIERQQEVWSTYVHWDGQHYFTLGGSKYFWSLVPFDLGGSKLGNFGTSIGTIQS